MLNPLRNYALVLKVAKDVGQMFIRRVKGQLAEREGGDRTVSDWTELFCLLTEIDVVYGCQHVQRVVKVVGLILKWRRGR